MLKARVLTSSHCCIICVDASPLVSAGIGPLVNIVEDSGGCRACASSYGVVFVNLVHFHVERVGDGCTVRFKSR